MLWATALEERGKEAGRDALALRLCWQLPPLWVKMEDSTTRRRHRAGPGALLSGLTPGYLKVAHEGAELQRSRSVGGLHQKGDPPVGIRKLLHKEPVPGSPYLWERSRCLLSFRTEEVKITPVIAFRQEAPVDWMFLESHSISKSEDQGNDPRSDSDDASCQVHLEEDRKKKDQEAQGKVDDQSGKKEPEKSDSEASTTEEQDDACTKRCASVAEEQEPESIKLNDLEKQKSSVFVEIDLGDHAEEEVVTCALREEKRPPMDTGDLSEEETRTNWVCCIPYTTRRKAEGNVAALEKS